MFNSGILILPEITPLPKEFAKPKYRYSTGWFDLTIVDEDDKKDDPLKGMPNSYQEDD